MATFFCNYFSESCCGTAGHAAQKLNSKWIGINITLLAISLIEKRLKDAFKTGLAFESLKIAQPFMAG